ncbi:hypothetical protein HYH03_009703 [Edaphochlamys debaryana]|uniref:Uncharacterized protein n=1 Tax=Edaphochlamys debaryana TaxID=47281 RepID=A0A835XVN0_9CHLO|nr:hypothetical protein HYH03_009703 [Edaphochlamys debaryana]|eukprot:KAG2491972.1 hypothetical protein HYH03_009703 [Edaphochlamys debaryana]
MELGDSLAPPWLRRVARGTAESTSPTEQAPEAASGPPLTPAQRRLLVAAGAGFPARLLSSRPSQQAQALAQQPVRGAWRAGATYRPALRAAATAALTAAAPQPMTPAVDVPAALSAESWRKARSDWRDFQTAVPNLRRAKEALASRGKRGEADIGEANAAYQSLIDRGCQLNAYAVASALTDCAQQAPCRLSNAGGGGLPPSLLLGAWDDAPMWVGSEAQLLPGRAALLCAMSTQLFVGVFLAKGDQPDGEWMVPADGTRQQGLKGTMVLAQALLQQSGCASPSRSHLRTFAFVVLALMSHAAKKPGLVQALAAATPGPLAALTSVPALAKLARATADTMDAATPNTELLMLPTDQYKLAETVVEAYTWAVMQAARDAGLETEDSAPAPGEEPALPSAGDPADCVAGCATHCGADGLAEAVEAACASWLADSGHARTQEAVDADSQTGCKGREKADAECLKCTEQVLQALRPGGAHRSVNAKGDVSPKVWLAMHKARQGASELRLAVLRARLGSWLPAEMGSIARAVCRSVAVSSAGEAGAEEALAAAQPGGAWEEVEELRLESSQLASPSTRAALARALVAAHLDQRPTRVAVCNPPAFALLASAAAILVTARDTLWDHMQQAMSVGIGTPPVTARNEDCGRLPGLLLQPGGQALAAADDGRGADQGWSRGGDGCSGRGSTASGLEVEVVPLSFESVEDAEEMVQMVSHMVLPVGPYIAFTAGRLVERLDTYGSVCVAPNPPHHIRALDAMVEVCVQTLALLRAAGRQAVLLPELNGPTGCEAAAWLSRDLMMPTLILSATRGPVGILPQWRQRLRLASTTAIGALLRDGCVAFDDESGRFHKLARVAVGDTGQLDERRTEQLSHRAGSSSLQPKIAVFEAGVLLNEELHQALDAELDVRQMGSHGVVYRIVEVDPSDPSTPVGRRRAQGREATGSAEARPEARPKARAEGNGQDEGVMSLMDEMD